MAYYNKSEDMGAPRPSPRRLVTYGNSNRRRNTTEQATLIAPTSKQPSSSSLAMPDSKTTANPKRDAASVSPGRLKSAFEEDKQDLNDVHSTELREEQNAEPSKIDGHVKRSHTQAFVAKSEQERRQRKIGNQRVSTLPNPHTFSEKLGKKTSTLLTAKSQSLSQPKHIESASPASVISITTPSRASLSSEQIPRQNQPPSSVKTLALPRRRRLIDALAAQRTSSSDTDESESPNEVTGPHQMHTYNPVTTQSPGPSFSRDVRTAQRSDETPNRKKIKFTYSHARSFRSETQDHAPPTISSTTGDKEPSYSDPFAIASPAAFDFDESDNDNMVDGAAKVAIKSVHELRRAGANNRFADEMEDLLSRIGQPGKISANTRRTALFDLVQKLQFPEFANQFRDHGTRDHLVSGIGGEEDIISGFGICAALVIFLSTGSAPHLLQQLAREGVGRLLSRLLQIRMDVDDFAGDGKHGVEKSNRVTLRAIKKSLAQRKIWHGFECKILSPRRLALQLLDMFVRCADAPNVSVVMREAEEGLFSVANTFINSDIDEDVDFALLVSILEAQSGLTTALDDTILNTDRWSLPVATCLERILQKWPNQKPNSIGPTVIKLAINTTNATGGAAAFDRSCLLTYLVDCICKGFNAAQSAVGTGRLDSDIYDDLLLVLGVGINIFEHCPSARSSIEATSQNNLIQLYSDNYASITEADSEEKSKLSVGFGYLAVMLGYLSLSRPVRTKVEASGRGLRQLIKVIQQFTAIFKHVSSKAHELETLVTNLRTGTWTT